MTGNAQIAKARYPRDIHTVHTKAQLRFKPLQHAVDGIAGTQGINHQTKLKSAIKQTVHQIENVPP